MLEKHEALRNILAQVTLAQLEEEGYSQRVRPDRCVLIAHVHVLPSTVALFERLIELGFQPRFIIVVPKPYSTIQRAYEGVVSMGCEVINIRGGPFTPGYYDSFAASLLDRACALGVSTIRDNDLQRCVLIDDGGVLTGTWERLDDAREIETISVQQTASGFHERTSVGAARVRRLDVARSAAKKQFESRIIVDGVLRKVRALGVVGTGTAVAVIGLGAVGRQLVAMLSSQHRAPVFTFECNPRRAARGGQHGAVPLESWDRCMSAASVVFGCTGLNFMENGLHRCTDIVGGKTLVSLSSRDIEFRELLRHTSGETMGFGGPYGRVVRSPTRRMRCTILNGGFPINFDREREWEHGNEIALTRGLILLGILQAVCAKAVRGPYAVDSLARRCQKQIVASWLQQNGKRPADYGVTDDDFEKADWWQRTTEGPSYYKGNWRASGEE